MQELSKNSFENAIKDGVCVVDVGAPWCPDCRKIEPIMAILEGEYKEVKFFSVPADKEEELKNELNIRRIPTLIFYKNGVEVGERLVEPDSKFKIESAIKAAL